MRERFKRKKSKQKFKKKQTQYAMVLLSQLDARDETVLFDTDGMTAITDNSANAHIFNGRSLFVGDILSMDPNTGVATMGGTNHWPQGIREAEILWKDDEGVSH
eukprot:13895775-Ditylum_brightwellii.AAC.1